jgi:hypothetical protein
MGVVVFSGMIGVTVFGLLLTPVFYVLVRRFSKRERDAIDRSVDPALDAPRGLPPTNQIAETSHA